VEALAKHAGVPVWNGLTDADHPTQILADMMTIEEHCAKPLNRVKVVFPGDVRNNMCYAWMIGAAKMVQQSGRSPEELKNAVCSPGGSTLAGVRVLDSAGFTNTVSECVHAAYKRNQELGK
jgi:hypothetical protein